MLTKAHLDALIAKARAAAAVSTDGQGPSKLAVESKTAVKEITVESKTEASAASAEASWLWNPEQLDAISRAKRKESFCLIGAAGTGKTTTTREIAGALIRNNVALPLPRGTKYLQEGAPGVVAVSFTRRAVRNLRKALDGTGVTAITIHKLLEFAPVYYEVWDEAKKQMRTTMRFEPTRNASNPLPAISCIIYDESSMVSTQLYNLVQEALPRPAQELFLGDLNQLPPVYGRAILGFKLNELPVVELIHIYRQALLSPIIRFAHRILKGTALTGEEWKEFQETSEHGKLTMKPWSKRVSDTYGLKAIFGFFNEAIDKGLYDPEEHVILCPFNVSFGTVEINKHIAGRLGAMRGAVVHEVIAGFLKHYFAEGDRVLYDREDCEIVSIHRNAKYMGQRPQKPSKDMNRWGHMEEGGKAEASEFDAEDEKGIEAFLESIDLDKSERVKEASHIVTLRNLETDQEISISSAGDVNELLFAYALTVHKAQGSEWKKVFLILHHTHQKMASRELLYTAVTRAREELYIIFEPDRPSYKGTFHAGILNQAIKGKTWQEKAEKFKGDYKGSSENNGSQLIRGSDLVSIERKREVGASLEAFMERARHRFPSKLEKFTLPNISYELRSKACGKAKYSTNTIYINPVYLGSEDPAIIRDMVHDTVGHELAHLVTKHIYREGGHGYYWKHVMRELGLEPSRIAGIPYPPHLTLKYKLLQERFAERLNEEESEDSED